MVWFCPYCLRGRLPLQASHFSARDVAQDEHRRSQAIARGVSSLHARTWRALHRLGYRCDHPWAFRPRMTPRPLHKWKSFWLGILVLGFLGWVWGRSNGKRDIISFEVGADRWNVISTLGKISAQRFEVGARRSGVHFWTESTEGWTVEVPAAFEHFVTEHRRGSLTIWNVGYWPLMLLFLIPWSAFLAWRWRRQRILTKTNGAPPAP